MVIGNMPQSVNEVLNEAHGLKAEEGARRLRFVATHCQNLAPEATYRWLDPEGFQHEVEEALAHRVAKWHILRNCWSVFPLILTWIALYGATDAYQKDTYPGDAGKSFLQLWQEGFHRTTPLAGFLTFSTAAAIDVILLGIFVGLIFLSSFLDSRAYTRSTRFAAKLEKATQELVARSNSLSINSQQSTVTNVANAVQQVVNQAMQESRQLMSNAQTAVDNVVQAAQQAINTSNNNMQDLFNNMIRPMMVKFNTDMQTLHAELANYQTRLTDLTNASQALAGASTTLTNNASLYTKIGQDINQSISQLNTTQSNVLGQIQAVAGGVAAAASDMQRTATNMGNATKAVENVATQLDTGLRSTLGQMTRDVSATATTMKDGMDRTVTTMTNHVARATVSLANVGPQLEAAATTLNVVSQNMGMGLGFIQPTPQTQTQPPPTGWQRFVNGGVMALFRRP